MGHDPFHTDMQITGTPDDIAKIALQISWMISVFRKPSKEGLALSKVKIEYLCHQAVTSNSRKEIHLDFAIKVQGLEPVAKQNSCLGNCWNPIFRSFVIADGFQIPLRLQTYSGIELPLPLMSILAQVDYPMQYLDSFVLKGRRTAIIPVFSKKDADQRYIQWHLVQSDDNGSDLSMETLHEKVKHGNLIPWPVTFESFVNSLDNNENRHFLGLYHSATIHLGTQDSHAEIIRTSKHRHSVRPLKEPRILWKRNITPSLSIPLGPIGIGVSTTLELGLSNSTRFQLNVEVEVDERMRQSCRNLTVLYDTTRRIAWLVPEICVILHLIQSYTRRQQYQTTFPTVNEITPSNIEVNCRNFLHQGQELPNQTRNSVRFWQFDNVFRQMKENVILDQRGRRLTFFGSRRKLIGVDFWELSNLPTTYGAHQVNIDQNSSGGWMDILTSNTGESDSDKVLTLFCENLNRPIRPSLEVKSCGTWATPIPGMDYLVTTVFCIKTLNHRHGGDPPKLSPSYIGLPEPWTPLTNARVGAVIGCRN